MDFLKRKYKPLLLLFLSILMVSGCNTGKNWTSEIGFRVLEGDLSIKDVVGDSLIGNDPNGDVILNYSMEVESINLTDVITVPDTTLERTVTLETLDLGTRSVTRFITLGEIARNAGIQGFFLILNNGNTIPIPAINNISTGETDLDATDFFESATFVSGELEMLIINKLPIELRDLNFEIRNKNIGGVLISEVISSLPPNSTYSNVYDLEDRSVEGNLVAEVLNMNSPGSNGQPVLIDTSDALEVYLIARNMLVKEATAIFPAQDVVDNRLDIEYNLEDALVKKIILERGNIRLNAAHTVEDTLQIKYIIPETKLDGKPLFVEGKVPPATKGQTSSISEIFKADGYTVDLTGQNKDKFNTFYNELYVSIDSTGIIRSFSLEDSIFVFYGFTDVVPRYAEGYLGKTSFVTTNQEIAFDGFKNVSGSFRPKKMNVQLDIANAIGAPINANITKLTAKNSRTGVTVDIQHPELGTEILINPALNNPIRPSYYSVSLNETNSNILDAIEIIPDMFLISSDISINKNGYDPSNPELINQFVYLDSNLSINLTAELPLEATLRNFTLIDTFEADLGLDPNAETDGILDISLDIEIENSMPLEVALNLKIYNTEGLLIETITIEPDNIIKGSINGDFVKSRVLGKISKAGFDALINNPEIVVEAVVNTETDEPVKILDTQRVLFKVLGGLKYNIDF